MMKQEDHYIEPKIDVLNWVLTIIAAVVVGLRIYNKYRRRIELWWDDYIAIVSWVSATIPSRPRSGVYQCRTIC